MGLAGGRKAKAAARKAAATRKRKQLEQHAQEESEPRKEVCLDGGQGPAQPQPAQPAETTEQAETHPAECLHQTSTQQDDVQQSPADTTGDRAPPPVDGQSEQTDACLLDCPDKQDPRTSPPDGGARPCPTSDNIPSAATEQQEEHTIGAAAVAGELAGVAAGLRGLAAFVENQRATNLQITQGDFRVIQILVAKYFNAGAELSTSDESTDTQQHASSHPEILSDDTAPAPAPDDPPREQPHTERLHNDVARGSSGGPGLLHKTTARDPPERQNPTISAPFRRVAQAARSPASRLAFLDLEGEERLIDETLRARYLDVGPRSRALGSPTPPRPTPPGLTLDDPATSEKQATEMVRITFLFRRLDHLVELIEIPLPRKAAAIVAKRAPVSARTAFSMVVDLLNYLGAKEPLGDRFADLICVVVVVAFFLPGIVLAQPVFSNKDIGDICSALEAISRDAIESMKLAIRAAAASKIEAYSHCADAVGVISSLMDQDRIRGVSGDRAREIEERATRDGDVVVSVACEPFMKGSIEDAPDAADGDGPTVVHLMCDEKAVYFTSGLAGMLNFDKNAPPGFTAPIQVFKSPRGKYMGQRVNYGPVDGSRFVACLVPFAHDLLFEKPTATCWYAQMVAIACGSPLRLPRVLRALRSAETYVWPEKSYVYSGSHLIEIQ